MLELAVLVGLVAYAWVAVAVWRWWDRSLPRIFPLTYRARGGRHAPIDHAFMLFVALCPVGWAVTLLERWTNPTADGP